MQISNVRAVIKVITPDGIEDFGFSYSFEDGLNILTGDNSSGKSTVLSCIYYCLGMEQLMGSKGVNALSPALHKEITFSGKFYKVLESECFLKIKATNDKYYDLSRQIKSDDKTSFNEIIISDGSSVQSKFVHSERDHGTQGFYQWLSEVNNLELVGIESTKAGKDRPLYMQNVFTLSFLEQTKGWSDIFSMMPSFGIKDPKQKVVEYCLGLNSLSVNIKLDQVKVELERKKSEWTSHIRDINYRSRGVQVYISKIDEKAPDKLRAVKSLYAAEIHGDGEERNLTSVLGALSKSIEVIEDRIKNNVDDSKTVPAELLKERKTVQSSLDRYIKERHEVSDLEKEERYKIAQYESMLQDINGDLQDFKDIKKVSIGRNWSKVSSISCPVCDSNLKDKRDENLSSDVVDKTASFLISQKSTYEKYLVASKEVIGRYEEVISYYDRTISLKKEQLDSLYEDLKSPSVIAVRSEYEKIAELKLRRNELVNFQDYFIDLKDRLSEISNEYYILKQDEKDLKSEKTGDSNKINNFKTLFKRNLDSFGYRSNGVSRIDIKEDSNLRLLPSVSFQGQMDQYIRYVSSASDFVRSIWSYYITLLVDGVRHPGFLIMDEPGQHQMRVDSMKELLKVSSKTGKQVILAISQDRKYFHNEGDFNDPNNRTNIGEIIKGLDDYTLRQISDGDGCIVKLAK